MIRIRFNLIFTIYINASPAPAELFASNVNITSLLITSISVFRAVKIRAGVEQCSQWYTLHTLSHISLDTTKVFLFQCSIFKFWLDGRRQNPPKNSQTQLAAMILFSACRNIKKNASANKKPHY